MQCRYRPPPVASWPLQDATAHTGVQRRVKQCGGGQRRFVEVSLEFAEGYVGFAPIIAG
jgi:hypothetical protein